MRPHTAIRMLMLSTLTCMMLPLTSGRTVEAQDKLPRVLILGDSISIGYTPEVQKLMQGEATVLRPTNARGGAENCAGTNNGVKHIDRWLKIDGGQWDVIHFNFGLHDLKRVDGKTGQNSNNPTDPYQADPETYRRQLTEIVEKLKGTGATLIFATTTPVPPGGVKPHRAVDDPQRYNDIAREIMKQHGIGINDLFAVINPRLEKLQRPVNVHFTPEGSRVLAEAVVTEIRQALAKTPRRVK